MRQSDAAQPISERDSWDEHPVLWRKRQLTFSWKTRKAMPITLQKFDRDRKDEDWEGNNATFTCLVCARVFIVSGLIHRQDGRKCPDCGKSTARVQGSKNTPGGSASIEWEA
jgi:hypothetical protein